MAQSYVIQPSVWLIGDESNTSTLTATYANNVGTIHVGGMSQAEIYITYVPAENNAVLLVQEEMGPADDDLYLRVTQSISTTNELITVIKPPTQYVGATASTSYKLRLSEPMADKVYRLSFKETVSSLFGTIKVRTTISGL